nr:uncharacterized hydrolase YugF-like isoform X1 [Ipomoea batatas]
MTLVGPSLGSAIAIDFSVNYPEAVDRLVLIDASVYAEGTGNLATLPKAAAYAGVYLLKSIPLRLYATSLAFNGLPFNILTDWANVQMASYDFVLLLFRLGGYIVYYPGGRMQLLIL